MKSDRRRFLTVSAAGLVGAGLEVLGSNENAVAQETGAKKEEIHVPFSFCVVADPHCADKAGVRHAYNEGLEKLGGGVDKFLACVREMGKLQGDERPDFMLVVGDIHLWALRDHLDKVDVPMHVIAGNHETFGRKKEMRDLFPDDFKKGGRESDYYSFVHKGVRFIGVCDAGRGGDHVGQLCSEDFGPRGQCEWLEKELAHNERHKIVFAHIPPEPNGEDRRMYLSRNDSRYFNALIEQTRPTAMFFGHLHSETAERKIGRTRSFTVRSCCWNFERTSIGFMHVRMTPRGIVTREITTGVHE